MTGADEETIELRLLGDSTFQEEFDITVDEIAARYVNDQFTGEERRNVEEHFLKSPERQNKVKFIGELLRQSSVSQREQTPNNVTDNTPSVAVEPKTVVQPKPGVFESIRSWWGNQSLPLRAATTFATLIIVVGVAFLLRPGSGQPTYQSLELAMASSDRNIGNQNARVKLGSGVDGLRIKLKVPGDAPPAKSYRVQLRGESISRQLPVEQQDSQSLTVVVPAKDLTRGSYAIELSAIADNGTEVPLRGAYLFEVD